MGTDIAVLDVAIPHLIEQVRVEVCEHVSVQDDWVCPILWPVFETLLPVEWVAFIRKHQEWYYWASGTDPPSVWPCPEQVLCAESGTAPGSAFRVSRGA